MSVNCNKLFDDDNEGRSDSATDKKVLQAKDLVPENYFDLIDESHEDIRKSIERDLPFVCDALKNKVPFHYPNMFLVGAVSGRGKTTFLSALAYSFYQKKLKLTFISGEEMAVNLYNRLACLELGLDYSDIKVFEKSIHERLKKVRRKIGEYIFIIDKYSYKGNYPLSSLEGLKEVCEYLKDSDSESILIDYFSSFSRSAKNSHRTAYSVLDELSDYLADFYIKFKGPIVVSAQLWDANNDRVSFYSRLEGAKTIYQSTTIALEIKSEIESSVMNISEIKGRYSSDQKHKVKLKYEKGHLKAIP